MKHSTSRRGSIQCHPLQWTSLSDCSSDMACQILSTQPSLPSEKFNTNIDLQLTVLTQENSMLLSKQAKSSTRPRFTDLQQFQKQNFPGRNTAQSSFILPYEKQTDLQISFQNQPKPIDQLEQLSHQIQHHKNQFESCLKKSDSIYGKQIEIINEYYKQLHLILDVEKNKHYNNILIMKKNADSQMKINFQMADIYLQQIDTIIGKSITQKSFQIQRFNKNIDKYMNFLGKCETKEFQVYNFELGCIEDIKSKFLKMISIEMPNPIKPIEKENKVRRKKAQSMEPRLKVLSPMKNKTPRFSINEHHQLVIEEEVDLQYTDGENSGDNLSK